MKLEETIGMEPLLTLGGFVETTARKIIKTAWENALPMIAVQNGASPWDAASEVTISKIISDMIEAYKYVPGNEGLYSQLMEVAEDFFAAEQAEEPEPDEEDMNQRMVNSEE